MIVPTIVIVVVVVVTEGEECAIKIFPISWGIPAAKLFKLLRTHPLPLRETLFYYYRWSGGVARAKSKKERGGSCGVHITRNFAKCTYCACLPACLLA